MAWTDPRTWATGELVTADIMNTHVRDNLNYLLQNAGGNGMELNIQASLPMLVTGGTTSGAEIQSYGGTPAPQVYQMRMGGTVVSGRCWSFSLPPNYASTPYLEIGFNTGTASTAGSTVIFGVQVAAVGNGDTGISTKSFAAAQYGTVTIAGTSYTKNMGTISISNTDSMAAKDKLCLYLFRNGTADTNNNDILVTDVNFFYTAQ